MTSIKIIGLGIVLFLSQNTSAQETENTNWKGNRPDGHAPISVKADHYHGKGGLMFSYKFMNMNMESLLSGDDAISNDNAHNAGYKVTPLRMPMQMHMFGMMYAPSDRITLLGMVKVINIEMDLQAKMENGMLKPFSSSSSGFGDVTVGMIYKILNKNKQSFHGNLTFSLPAGNISVTDETPMSAPNEIQLPYPMQIGSGTFDTNLGFTYLGQRDSFSWGSQITTTLRLGENADDYAFGNTYGINNWIAIKATDWLSISGRLEGMLVDKIRGSNPNLMPIMVTTANTQNTGGTYINSGIGFNLYAHKGTFKDLRLGFEFAAPLYQKIKGIQLKRKETITVGLQYSL